MYGHFEFLAAHMALAVFNHTGNDMDQFTQVAEKYEHSYAREDLRLVNRAAICESRLQKWFVVKRYIGFRRAVVMTFEDVHDERDLCKRTGAW